MTLFKSLNYLLASTFLVGALAACSSGHRTTRNADGTTTEVRSVSNPSNRKASKSGKLAITRDSGGRVVSVKRSY